MHNFPDVYPHLDRYNSGQIATSIRGIYLNIVSPTEPSVCSGRIGIVALRAMVLLLGAAGWCLLATWIRLLDFQHRRFILIDSDWHMATLPTALVLATLACAGLGTLAMLWSLAADLRVRLGLRWICHWMKQHPGWTALLVVVFLLGAVDIYSVMSLGPAAGAGKTAGSGLSLFLLRDDLRYWLYLGAVTQLALAMLAWWPDAPSWQRHAHRWRNIWGCTTSRSWWLATMLIPLILAGTLSLYALDGIPHFSDALTYLMQGRMLHQGQLSMPAPQYPELWRDSLFFLTESRTIDPVKQIVIAEHGQRFFGKYPIGWPAIVGLFDRVNLLFLANATMAAFASLLTGLLAYEIAGRRIAVLAALVMGLSPWLWFSGADFASHVASTCALLAFLWLFLRTVREVDADLFKPSISSVTSENPGINSQLQTVAACSDQQPSASLCISKWLLFLVCGLALGTAVLIRPGDATNFAFPVGLVILWRMIRRPLIWVPGGMILAMGTAVGAFIYLWCNQQTTGQWLLSPYKLEPRWGSDWVPAWAMPGRFLFQWAQLNSRFPGFGLGGMTLAAIGLLVIIHTRKAATHAFDAPSQPGWGLWLLGIGTIIFFFFNTAFGFTTVWWGARWLLPATPLLAILIAFLIDQVLHSAAMGDENARDKSAAAQLALAMLIAGIIVGLFACYPGQAYELRIMPPHTVSGAVDQRVRLLGLEQAVVAMPMRGKRAPLDTRAGIAFMKVPWDKNPVIYVRAVDEWQAKAAAMYPQRYLYEVLPDSRSPEGFILRRIASGDGSR